MLKNIIVKTVSIEARTKRMGHPVMERSLFPNGLTLGQEIHGPLCSVECAEIECVFFTCEVLSLYGNGKRIILGDRQGRKKARDETRDKKLLYQSVPTSVPSPEGRDGEDHESSDG